MHEESMKSLWENVSSDLFLETKVQRYGKIIQNHNFHFRFSLRQHIRCNYGLHVDVKTKLSQVDLLSDEDTSVDIINLLWSEVCVHQVHTFHSYQGRP